MNKKTYILLSDHRDVEGRIYKRGEKIELLENSAKMLTGKIIDPDNILIQNVSIKTSQDAVKIQQLNAEIERLNLELEKAKEKNSQLSKKR